MMEHTWTFDGFDESANIIDSLVLFCMLLGKASFLEKDTQASSK